MPEICSEEPHGAERSQLCFRSLDDGHCGKLCPKSRICKQNGCQEIHQRLLHQYNRRIEPSASNAKDHTEPKPVDAGQGEPRADWDTMAENTLASVTDGKEQHAQQTIKMTQNNSRADFIALRTVPSILKNGYRLLKVNALLDMASTKTYLYGNVAAELVLQCIKQVTLNALNGQIETFETKQVSFELLSVDRKVNTNVIAYTANTLEWVQLQVAISEDNRLPSSCKQISRWYSHRSWLSRSSSCDWGGQRSTRGTSSKLTPLGRALVIKQHGDTKATNEFCMDVLCQVSVRNPETECQFKMV